VSSTPPTIPPDIASSSTPDWSGLTNAAIVSLFSNLGPMLEGNREAVESTAAGIAAVMLEMTIAGMTWVGERLGEANAEWEQQAGPQILEAAAAALSDYFGVSIGAGQIDPRRGPDQRFAFAEQLGRLVLENMFGSFTAPKSLTPDAGRQNAERLLGFNIATSLESWLGDVTSKVPILNWIPNWADLDDVMSANLGLGRANRRVLGPLLKTLIVDPFTWDLNRRFAPARFSVAELGRLFNRRSIDQATYLEQMSWHGYSSEAASKMRVLNTTLPQKDDVGKMLELGLISEERARAIFEGQGFSEEGAAMMLTLVKEERVRSINTAMETVGRDLYRDRVIQDGEYRSILQAAGRAPGEIEALLGLGGLERSRPRDLPRADIEEGYRKGFIPLSRLREYYTRFGFALEDQVLLEELAVADRLETEAREEAAKLKAQGLDFRAVPAGQIERAYVEGRIAASRLREYYEARKYSPVDVGLLMDLAAGRKTAFDRELAEELERAKTPQFLQLPKATMEEAFFRDVVDAGRLRDWYTQTGLSPGDADLALRVAREKKAERAERLEEELKRANRPDFLELPRAVMEGLSTARS